MTPLPLWARLAVTVALAVAYWGSGRLGQMLAGPEQSAVTLIWPPAGIAFAAVYGLGRWTVPGLIVGSFAMALDAHPGVWSLGLVVAFTNVLPALVSDAVLRRRGVSDIFRDPFSATTFVAVACLLAPLLGAIPGSLVLWATTGPLPTDRWPTMLGMWWLADGMGTLIVAPFLLVLPRWRLPPSPDRWIELACLQATQLLLWWAVFFAPDNGQPLPLSFVAVPVVIWAAMRLDIAAAMTAVFGLAVVTVTATGLGIGPFAGSPVSQAIANLHIFLGVTSCVGLFLGVSIGQSRRAMTALADEIVRHRQSQGALATANAELGQFAHVLAHDLQEPLRIITSYSQLVSRQHGQSLDAEARGWLGEVVEASLRMRMLLRDTQLFLAEGKLPLPMTPSSAADALVEAVDRLFSAIDLSGAQIDSGPLPSVMADRRRLVEILTILLGNAVEYRMPSRPPVIRVGHRRDHGYDVIDIEDNGIGIDEQYHERIFAVFQRLHTRSSHAGTGMGLAIAQKMAQRLGGHISVRSTPGEGSLFSLHLPASDEFLP